MYGAIFNTTFTLRWIYSDLSLNTIILIFIRITLTLDILKFIRIEVKFWRIRWNLNPQSNLNKSVGNLFQYAINFIRFSSVYTHLKHGFWCCLRKTTQLMLSQGNTRDIIYLWKYVIMICNKYIYDFWKTVIYVAFSAIQLHGWQTMIICQRRSQLGK